MTKYLRNEVDPKSTQLRKGILELAIMTVLARQAHYGYSLVRSLTRAGELDLKEGTIYPILARMAKEGLVASEWVESNQGPPRKYYRLTAAGRTAWESLDREFRRLVHLVDQAGRESAGEDAPEIMKPISIRRDDHE